MALLPCSAPVPLLALRGGIIALSEQYHGRAFHSHGWRCRRTVYRVLWTWDSMPLAGHGPWGHGDCCVSFGPRGDPASSSGDRVKSHKESFFFLLLCALAPYFPFPYAGWSYRMPVPVLLRFAEEEQALHSLVHRGDIWWIPPSNPQTAQEKMRRARHWLFAPGTVARPSRPQRNVAVVSRGSP
ncbi:hypothetical protein EDB80DRAFT_69425 [Ilyonectria destructans]|nr:hypothetical protein EDB80DRAFT_69425 [Ilyonectria destructans]